MALLVVLALIALAGLCLWQRALDRYGGHWVYAPEDAPWVLDGSAQKLIENTFADAKKQVVVDHGVHLLTQDKLSASNADNNSRPARSDRPGPMSQLRRELHWRAGGISADSPRPDVQYLARLVRQIRAMPAAYQAWVQARDVAQPAAGHGLDLSSSYVVEAAGRSDATLDPVVAIRPGQPGRIAHWLQAGVSRAIWNPALQPLDPTAKSTKAMYRQLVDQKTTLQVRVGQQTSADGTQLWISPAIVQPALDAGVHVELILGAPAGARGQRLMPALFDLLAQAEHVRQLTVSLAGVLTSDRIDSVLWPLLQHPQFYGRLVYASDYPDSASPGAVALDRLVKDGFIDPALETPLRAVYRVNPLLFVLATMRSLHLPNTTLGLPASVFFAPSSGQ